METAKRERRLIDRGGAGKLPRTESGAHGHCEPMNFADLGNPAGTATLLARSRLMNHVAPETRTAQQRTPLRDSPQELSAQLERAVVQYPLLEAVLAQKKLALKAIWALRDVAAIFDVSVRTIQDWARDQKLTARDLPGRGKFLSQDLEDFLVNSKRSAR